MRVDSRRDRASPSVIVQGTLTIDVIILRSDISLVFQAHYVIVELGTRCSCRVLIEVVVLLVLSDTISFGPSKVVIILFTLLLEVREWWLQGLLHLLRVSKSGT